MALSKGDLVAAVAKSTGGTKKSAADALEAVLGTVTKELSKGGTVTLTGFGTFKVSHRAARTGVNPQNPSQKIKIPATKVPTFKAGKNLKEAVR
ncbi:HU family DNA-binding protein [Candidatus Gracilibacteria bacterium]|nr:HU family DNA-binding protein [Candidatus Gracilibacteria bacterium]MCF7819524.1 HU family DNA-binding protein [Candidatus Gracilibacteria bacterium]